MGGGEEDCRTIPAIDLKKFPEAEEYRKLREAAETWGCFRLVNHMIPPALMLEMKSVVRSLLDLPMEIKKQNKDGISGSGYRAPTIVNPIYESLGFYDLGSRQALDSFCSQLNASSYPREVMEKYAQAVCEQTLDIGQKLAESLGLADNDYLKGWPCQFRMNKYTFTPESVGSTGLRLHTDPGFLTILQDDEIVGGLEVMDKSGTFVAVDPCPGTLLVNLGDVAQVICCLFSVPQILQVTCFICAYFPMLIFQVRHGAMEGCAMSSTEYNSGRQEFEFRSLHSNVDQMRKQEWKLLQNWWIPSTLDFTFPLLMEITES